MQLNNFKKLFYLLTLSVFIVSCSENDEVPEPKGPVYVDLVTYQAKLLGGQTNPSLGSFYSVSEDSIYLTSRANVKQEYIDLIYYFGSQTGDSSVIASPSDIVFNNVQDQNPHFAVKSWTDRNVTSFLKLNINQSTFNGLGNDSILQANLTDTTLLSKATKLKVGQVYGFKLETGKLGMFYVKEIDNTNALTRSITIDIKVQKP